MAFGFTPKYLTDIYLENITPQQFLVMAINIAKNIGWEIHYTSGKGFIAMAAQGLFKRKSKITIKIEDGIANIKSESTGKEMADIGFNKKLVTRFTDAFADVKYNFSPDELAQQYEELKPNLIAPEQDILNLPPPTAKQKFANFFSLFRPREGYYITPILVDINIAVFLLMVFSGVSFFLPDNESLIKWGANFRPVTLDGQWWRLITNCFLHIGIIHLAFNMYALIYIGIILEKYLGKLRFAVAYLLTGIIASVTSLYWHDLTISAGASGAIFGMYGVFLAMLTTNFIDKTTRKPLLISIGIFVFYNLANGMKAGIDNAAHTGGLISGLIIGYAFYPSLKKPESANLKYLILGLLSILVITITSIIYHRIPNGIVKYQESMNVFAANEETALRIYKMPENTPMQDLLIAIQDSGIYYWNKNIQILDEAEKLDIPATFQDRNKILMNYCNLRIKSYNLIYKAINENTTIYKDSIKIYNTQIQAIIDNLTGKATK